jgi:ribosomal protein S3
MGRVQQMLQAAQHTLARRLLARPLTTPPCTTRSAAYGVLRFVMEAGAKGCEVVVSGKLRAARAKSMKFKDGYMVASGYPAIVYLDSAVRHVLLRQGVLGLKVRRQRACVCVCVL